MTVVHLYQGEEGRTGEADRENEMTKERNEAKQKNTSLVNEYRTAETAA